MRPFENRSRQDRPVPVHHLPQDQGRFPVQLKINTNGTGWHESDINRWIADPVGWRPKGGFDEGR